MPAYHPFLTISKTIRLPEYGYIKLTEFEENIIDTKYFQRLRRIRQSPGVSQVYPGATHTRFEHSIGAMYVAGEAAMHLILNSSNKQLPKPIVTIIKNQSEFKKTAQLIQIARLGGLLHDIGHGPFSHTFELFLAESKINWTHENLSLHIIYKKLKPIFDKKNLNPYGVKAIYIMALLCDFVKNGNKVILNANVVTFLKSIKVKDSEIKDMQKFLTEHWYLNHLIKADPINIDRLNYLILDSNRSGAVEYGKIDFERLIQNLTIYQDTITVYPKAWDAFVRFIEAYNHMYKSVYLHKTAYGADLHLSILMNKAGKISPFFKKLMKPNIDLVLSLYDDVLMYELAKTNFSGNDKKLLDDFLNRKIITVAYETEDTKFPQTIEGMGGIDKFLKEVRKKSGLQHSDLIRIIGLDEIKAVKPPLTKQMIDRLMTHNKPSDVSTGFLDTTLLASAMSSKKLFRVYTRNDKDTKKKINDVIKKMLG